MKSSNLLFTLIYVTAGSVLLSQVATLRVISAPAWCGASGLACKNSSECCRNYCCIEGVCQQSTESVCNLCDGVACQTNESCQVIKDPYCTSEPCNDVPQCFPFAVCNKFCVLGYECVVDYTTSPPSSKCVSRRNPCDNVACPEFQRCYHEDTKCLLDPKRPVPVCAYSNPCNFINCPKGTFCSRTQEGNTPPKAQCVPLVYDACYAVICPENQTCYQRDVVCIQAPCLPVAECAYPDPCIYTKCSEYYRCEVHQEGRNPPTAECVLDYGALCGNVVCPKLQKCYIRNVTCVTAPCSPETVCAYYNACTLARCADGYKCVSVDNGYNPPTATCVPNRDYVCQNTVCPESEKCYLEDVGCATNPCPPRPICKPPNPCLTIDCADGNICLVNDQGEYPPTTECVPNPESVCSSHDCPVYQECYLQEVYCYVPPCPLKPVCAYPNPCLFVSCGEGYKCIEVRKDMKPPTAYCLQNFDLCSGILCEPGYACYVADAQCTDFHCYPHPPTAMCAPTDPCTTTLCPQNYTCVSTQVRTNPPVAKCFPPKSPCEGVACQSNEQCFIKDFNCNETGCFDIVPVAQCALPDPCIATQCQMNTTCLVVQIRRNPPRALCGQLESIPTCDNFPCDQFLQCYMKDYECNEFGCTNTEPRPVCSPPDPCRTTLCRAGTVCVIEQVRDNPPTASCKSISRLCDTTMCPTGFKCYIQDYVCGENGCYWIPEPYPTCALPSPCSMVVCHENSSCSEITIRNNPPQALCVQLVQTDLCVSVICNSGYSCYVKDVECDEFSCRSVEPGAICALSDPCAAVRCPDNTLCSTFQIRNNPPEAQCVSISPCTTVSCSPCQECFVRDYECNETGCHYIEPTGVCAYHDPCSITECADDGECFTHQIRDNPPISICERVPTTCDTMPCVHGKLCYLKDFKCDQYSCQMIHPTPVCAPIDPCTDVTCPANTTCISSQIRSNPPHAQCIPYGEMCNSVQCADGEKCYIVQVFCITTPCPPIAMCSPVDPCAITTCLPGYKCVNKQYGVNAPFAECIQLEDPCAGFSCSNGQECYLRKIPCLCPPCRYEPVCSYPNPCITALCPPEHGCYSKRVGRLEPVPVCYPKDDPCKAYDCLPGEQCFITRRACEDYLPCPVPDCSGDPTTYLCDLASCGAGHKCEVDMSSYPLVAKCVPLIDPCDYTLCPSESECVTFESYPPVAICSNVKVPKPCSVVTCRRGYRCMETKDKPRHAICTSTCKICPPTTDCVIEKTFPTTVRCIEHPRWLLTFSQK